MALSYGFYNSYDGDRKYNTEQISSMFEGVIKDGVFDSIGELLATVAGDGMQVIVKSGKAWFDRTWLVNSSPYPINLPLSDVTRNRIDAIVIETDHSRTTEGRQTSIKVVPGTPAYTPQKPEMVTGDFINQHPIAYVSVRAGVSEVTASDIEVNVGKSDCPFVTGILKSVPIDDLFNQWAANFQTFMTTKQTEWTEYLANQTAILNQWIVDTETTFNDWWADVKSKLDTDTAAKLTLATQDNASAIASEISRATGVETNLQNQINTKQNKITSTGLLKGDGNGGVTAAVAGTDYADAQVGEWRIKLFNDSGYWDAPASLVNPVHVMCFGGGGAGSYYYYPENTSSYVSYGGGNTGSGGSGRFTEKDLILVPNQRYKVDIGAGGTNPKTKPTDLNPDWYKPHWYCNGTKGGATSFGGTLVVADGGDPAYYANGGSGGAGGAGGDIRFNASYYDTNFSFNGGNGGRGYEFGGGGGGGSIINYDNTGQYITVKGGNGGAGGTYGGGGGGGGGMYTTDSTSSNHSHREQEVGVRGAKGTYGGYGGGKSSSSSTTMLDATDGSISEPLSKWYLMLAAQYIQLKDEATAGDSLRISSYGYSGGGGGGFHSKGGSAGYILGGSPSQNVGGYGGGGGGYGSPGYYWTGGRSGRGYGGFGFFDDLWHGSVDTYELYTPVHDNRWRAVLGASAGGAGYAGSANYGLGSSDSVLYGRNSNSPDGKSGLCIVFYRIRE